MNKLTFSIGGIHPSDCKRSADKAIETLPLPPVVYVSMAQHIGAPAKPVVEVGAKVKTGQVIAEPGGPISAFVHSPVSGEVVSIAPRKDLKGNPVTCVEIKVEGDEWIEGADLSEDLVTTIPTDSRAIIDKIKSCGVVGLGGATFPTGMKLDIGPDKKAECLIINGAECEPYLTNDYRTLLEQTKEVVIGAAIMQSALGGCRTVIAVEENKMPAVDALNKAIAELGYEGIGTAVLKKRYPQGGEKQLIDAVMHRQVASRAFPISVGALVQNVGTCVAVYYAVQKNRPLVSRVLTVTGDVNDDSRLHNYRIRIGMTLNYIAQCAGGIPEGTAKVVSGGPMMGFAIADMDAAALKSTSSLLFLSEKTTRRHPQGHCIRCGRCADACPMGLEPFLLNRLYAAEDYDALEKHAVHDCLTCGSCQYSCPANIPLLDNISVARYAVTRIIKARAK